MLFAFVHANEALEFNDVSLPPPPLSCPATQEFSLELASSIYIAANALLALWHPAKLWTLIPLFMPLSECAEANKTPASTDWPVGNLNSDLEGSPLLEEVKGLI